MEKNLLFKTKNSRKELIIDMIFLLVFFAYNIFEYDNFEMFLPFGIFVSLIIFSRIYYFSNFYYFYDNKIVAKNKFKFWNKTRTEKYNNIECYKIRSSYWSTRLTFLLKDGEFKFYKLPAIKKDKMKIKSILEEKGIYEDEI